jgi:hypothetical protein
MTISRSIPIVMEQFFSDSYTENKNTHFAFNFFFENLAFYVKIRKSIVEQESP